MNSKRVIILLIIGVFIGAIVTFFIMRSPEVRIAPDSILKKELNRRDSIIEVETGLKLASQVKFDSLQQDIISKNQSQSQIQIKYVVIYKNIDLQSDSADNRTIDSIFTAHGLN